MIHARDDYQRIQDPALHDPSLLPPGCTPIGEDEPVILFRAQDENLPNVVLAYRALITLQMSANPGYQEAGMAIVQNLERFLDRVEAWQEAHPPKLPDLPEPTPATDSKAGELIDG